MSNLNKVTLNFQKIKSKNREQNQENLVNYLVKDYHFTNDEAEILIDQAVQMNIIRLMLFNGKISHKILKADSVGYATILAPDTQVDKEKDDITANNIIYNETTGSLSTRQILTNTTVDKHEVDDITNFIERKFNYLSEIMEKMLHKLEDQIIRLQNLNLSGNVVNNKPVTSDSDLYADLLKNGIMELEK